MTVCKDFLPLMTIAGPLAVMLDRETVKSVKFCSLLSQTPVSFLRLLMQVNEWRFEASSGGRRTREMWQLMKLSEVRVESDSRTLRDKGRWPEQLTSVRESTWR